MQHRRSIARAVAVCGLAVAGAGFAALSGHSPAKVRIGGSFTLVDGAGRSVTERDFRGRFMLVYFGYTNCPDECPATLYKIAQALVRLGPLGRDIQPVFITVDPLRDPPAMVGRYAALFSPRIIGLSGTPAEIAAAERAYHVFAAGDLKTGAIQHSAIIYLMNPAGNFVTGIGASISADELVRILRRLAGG